MHLQACIHADFFGVFLAQNVLNQIKFIGAKHIFKKKNANNMYIGHSY